VISTVRISRQTRAKLRQLAKETGLSMAHILDRAVDGLYRKRLMEDLNRDYARLRADPKAWKEELRERELWDCTLADGLEDM
jgi:hypothetical protein